MITFDILDLILLPEIEKLLPYVVALTKLRQTTELPPPDCCYVITPLIVTARVGWIYILYVHYDKNTVWYAAV